MKCRVRHARFEHLKVLDSALQSNSVELYSSSFKVEVCSWFGRLVGMSSSSCKARWPLSALFPLITKRLSITYLVDKCNKTFLQPRNTLISFLQLFLFKLLATRADPHRWSQWIRCTGPGWVTFRFTCEGLRLKLQCKTLEDLHCKRAKIYMCNMQSKMKCQHAIQARADQIDLDASHRCQITSKTPDGSRLWVVTRGD